MLSFDTLRCANLYRLPQFKNTQGVHSHPGVKPEDGIHALDNDHWSPSDWMTAVAGEVGEAANIIKKTSASSFASACRPSFSLPAKSPRNVQIYLDLLALKLNIDLGQATIDKFNEVSKRVGSSVTIVHDGHKVRVDPYP